MSQIKVSLEPTQIDFLNNFPAFGFKDRSAMIRSAIDQLQAKLVHQQLQESAALYAELYEEEDEVHFLAESALEGWPE